MNRKNLTAAVLAGLAGAAGIAGTAQAVNLNPDGLGQVLIYPYFTSNDGNQTLLSVVNTTDNAKAIKVRFKEGFNSREVLDFNLYLSAWDVWVAAIAAGENGPTLYIPDDSCTVPYLYANGGAQEFLSLAYNDNALFSNDGGPTGIARAAEGHFEMIEMGTVVPGSVTEADITHTNHVSKDADGNTVNTWKPGDCAQLTTNWTRNADYSPLGIWTKDPQFDMQRNSGGLFGGASIVNSENGTMYSYNAQAIQGYDSTDGMRHAEPGGLQPNLNEGSEHNAWVFFGTPQNDAKELWYVRPVGAISAVFMHDNIMNEYDTDVNLSASTEWVVTFPTKNWYVDEELIAGEAHTSLVYWEPTIGAPNCAGWVPGDQNPAAQWNPGGPYYGQDPNGNVVGWEFCTFVSYEETGLAIQPFTELFQPDGKSCDLVGLKTWDRSERTFIPDDPTGVRPPVVSPSIPGPCDPEIQVCDYTPFELCYEVNVLRFGEGVVFGTPEVEGSSLLLEISDEFEAGWGNISFDDDPRHVDYAGLVGLPVTGFSAFEYENNFAEGGTIKAYYGGIFGHRASVRRTTPYHDQPGSDD